MQLFQTIEQPGSSILAHKVTLSMRLLVFLHKIYLELLYLLTSFFAQQFNIITEINLINFGH